MEEILAPRPKKTKSWRINRERTNKNGVSDNNTSTPFVINLSPVKTKNKENNYKFNKKINKHSNELKDLLKLAEFENSIENSFELNHFNELDHFNEINDYFNYNSEKEIAANELFDIMTHTTANSSYFDRVSNDNNDKEVNKVNKEISTEYKNCKCCKSCIDCKNCKGNKEFLNRLSNPIDKIKNKDSINSIYNKFGLEPKHNRIDKYGMYDKLSFGGNFKQNFFKSS